jgi:hypothetical protein
MPYHVRAKTNVVEPVTRPFGYHAFREVERVEYEANNIRKQRGNNGRDERNDFISGMQQR